MKEDFPRLIKSCTTRIVPSTETKPMGLPPTFMLQWFLLPNLENFIVTRHIMPIQMEKQKPFTPDADGNKQYRPPLAATILRDYKPKHHKLDGFN